MQGVCLGFNKKITKRGPLGIDLIEFGSYRDTRVLYTLDRTSSPPIPCRTPGLHSKSSKLGEDEGEHVGANEVSFSCELSIFGHNKNSTRWFVGHSRIFKYKVHTVELSFEQRSRSQACP